MSQKPETRFKEKVRADLQKLPNTYFVKIQQQTIVGTHDFHLCIQGKFITLELKKSKKDKPSPPQVWEGVKILLSGGVTIFPSPENWREILDNLSLLAQTKIKEKQDAIYTDLRKFAIEGISDCIKKTIKFSRKGYQNKLRAIKSM